MSLSVTAEISSECDMDIVGTMTDKRVTRSAVFPSRIMSTGEGSCQPASGEIEVKHRHRRSRNTRELVVYSWGYKLLNYYNNSVADVPPFLVGSVFGVVPSELQSDDQKVSLGPTGVTVLTSATPSGSNDPGSPLYRGILDDHAAKLLFDR